MRPSRRTFLVAALAAFVLATCSDTERTSSTRASAARVARASTRALLAATARAADVPGAVAAIEHATEVRDLVPLDARFVPRRLPVPHVAPGRAGSFTFDGARRGWFLRLPEQQQKLTSVAYADGRIFLGGGFSSTRFYGVDA